MVTFMAILFVGAVGGWALEQSLGQVLVRWTRRKRMRMRVLRRQGLNPWRAWVDD